MRAAARRGERPRQAVAEAQDLRELEPVVAALEVQRVRLRQSLLAARRVVRAEEGVDVVARRRGLQERGDGGVVGRVRLGLGPAEPAGRPSFGHVGAAHELGPERDPEVLGDGGVDLSRAMGVDGFDVDELHSAYKVSVIRGVF